MNTDKILKDWKELDVNGALRYQVGESIYQHYSQTVEAFLKEKLEESFKEGQDYFIKKYKKQGMELKMVEDKT